MPKLTTHSRLLTLNLQQIFTFFTLPLITLAFLFFSSLSHSGELKLVINNISNNKGQLIVRFYNNKDDWMSKKDKEIALEKRYSLKELSTPAPTQEELTSADKLSSKIKPTTYQLAVSIELAPDNYSFYLFHDLNNDNKLATNWIGIPKEPIATSNSAKGFMGPPKYKDANFKMENAIHQQVLSLVEIN